MNAILGGLDFTELSEEISRLRVRKPEWEDIISRNQSRKNKVNPTAIVRLMKESLENWNEENLPAIVKHHITKIYANPDGSFEVNIGVHLIGCGGRI